jgi:DNA sulfur modification protein DndE
MIALPPSITLSKRVTDQFRTIKTRTGITNNVLARMAIALAIESQEDVSNAHKEDSLGQTLDKELLFGDLSAVYEAVIREYMLEREIELSAANTIASLVEIGAHKMSHVRSLEQFAELG